MYRMLCPAGELTPFSPSYLTPAELEALHRYQGVDYSVINMALRDPYAFYSRFPLSRNREVLSLIEALDSALDKHAIESPAIVYRGLSKAMHRSVAQRVAGTVFSDPGFVSTTLSLNKALEFSEQSGMIFRIRVPDGTPAIGLDTIDDLGEEELLIARNKRFRMLAFREQKIHVPGGSTRHRRLVIDAVLLSDP